MSKLLIPNTCQVPNVLLDEVIPRLPGGAVRVLLAIVRFTYGFGKPSDRISYGQLSKVTGLSRRQVIDAVKALGDLINVVQGAKGRGANEYSLNLSITTGKLLSSAQNFTSEETRTGEISGQGVVKKTAPFQTHISKPTRAKISPTKDPDSRVREFLAFWRERYRERFGEPYHFTEGKDGALVKRLLKSFDLPRLKELTAEFFTTADPWVQEKGGYTIGVLSVQINKIVSTAKVSSIRPQPQEMPA